MSGNIIIRNIIDTLIVIAQQNSLILIVCSLSVTFQRLISNYESCMKNT